MYTLLFLSSAAGLFVLQLFMDFLIYHRPALWLLNHMSSPVTAAGKWVTSTAFCIGLVTAVVRDLRRAR